VKGIVFDIREFTVHDGPGSRITVFLKGCRLRCFWCHNPEGLSPKPQLMVKENRCVHCGRCLVPCNHPDCAPFKRCLHACPDGLAAVSGVEMDALDLSKKLLGYRDFLEDGGVTLSGGEPLLQADFSAELFRRIRGMHRALQTSGFAELKDFKQVLAETDYVLFDLKIADREIHRKYTGEYNDSILRNYACLLESGIPHSVRVPLIPGITDTHENIKALAKITQKSPVELMRYNRLAGAKYPLLKMNYPLGEIAPKLWDEIPSFFRQARFV
jgi:pyruvate formate lyase activating enzyme